MKQSDSCVTQVDITLLAEPLSVSALLSVMFTIPAPTPDRRASIESLALLGAGSSIAR